MVRGDHQGVVISERDSVSAPPAAPIKAPAAGRLIVEERGSGGGGGFAIMAMAGIISARDGGRWCHVDGAHRRTNIDDDGDDHDGHGRQHHDPPRKDWAKFGFGGSADISDIELG